MKRFISLIMAVMMTLTCIVLPANAIEIKWSGLAEIGTVPTSITFHEISYQKDGRYIRITSDVLDDKEIEYLLNVFSDSNLNCIKSDYTESVSPTDVIQSARVVAFDDDSYNQYLIYFNEKNIFISILSETAWIMKQGLFEFKNADTYKQLEKFIEENEIEQHDKNISDADEQMKNAVNIYDFKIIYKACFKNDNFADNFEIGICSYVRDGEREPVVVPYHGIITTDNMFLALVCETPDSNCISTEEKRMIQVNKEYGISKEYDCNTELLYKFTYYINIADNNQAQGIAVDNKRKDTGMSAMYYVDMNECEQTGELLSTMFSSKNNVEYANKTDSFTKLYSESLNAESNIYFRDSEWGICKYSNALSGEVHAFYFYSALSNVYLISEINDALMTMPSGDVTAKYHNIIDFETGRAIQNGYEIFDYSFLHPFSLHLGISRQKQIVYRGVFYNDTQKNLQCSFKTKSGNLDCLQFREVAGDNQQDVGIQQDTPDDEQILEENKQEENKQTEVKPDNEQKAEEQEKEVQPDEEKTEADIENEENISLDYDFIDVPDTHWAYNEIHRFAEQKIVLGYGNGYFGVDDHITYEHFALLLERLFDYKADNTERVPAVREDIIVSVVKALKIDALEADDAITAQKFSDCANIQAKNAKYIAAATQLGLVVGFDGKLFPEQQLTRAETVMLLSRALEYSK